MGREKDGKRYLGNHQPLISKKLFDQVAEVMDNRNRPKKKKLYFPYRGLLTCNNCGCLLTASRHKIRHVYYYCTNGKHTCEEHKNYFKENYVSQELVKVFDEVVFDEKIIELAYQAKKEKLGRDDEYLAKAQENLNNSLKTITTRKNALLDLFLDGNIAKEIYDEKNKMLNNEEVNLKKELNDLESKKRLNGEETLERIKNIFLFPIIEKKCFLKGENEKQEKVIKTLLWNAQIKNKKIANLHFKEPYNLLAKVEDKSDFLSVRKEGDSNPRGCYTYALSKRAHSTAMRSFHYLKAF